MSTMKMLEILSDPLSFAPHILDADDYKLACDIVGGDEWLEYPDVVLAPDGEPYLYRWHVIYNNAHGNVFFHIQVRSDPERPLHDHPWDNTSVILSGGYDEFYEPSPQLVPLGADGSFTRMMRCLRKGDTVHRKATTAHRLILPSDIPYTMTLFVTGPKRREWGFWYPDGFHHNKRHVDDRDPRGSVHHVTEGVQ